MLGKARGTIAFAAALVLGLQPASAQDGGALTSKIELEKLTATTEGQPPAKSYTAPDVVVPGDRVRITLTFTNGGTAPAAGVNIVNPIPEGLIFDGTNDGAGFSVSVDKGKSFGALETLTIPVDGAAPRAATANDVTQVRWLLPSAVPPGKTHAVAFFGKVK